MGRDPNHPYRDLIDYPVQQIDAFLLDFGLEDEWVGILGGPNIEEGRLTVTYNVWAVDGPYCGKISADFDYRFAREVTEEVPEIYCEQVNAIETAFPEAAIQCYRPASWQEKE